MSFLNNLTESGYMCESAIVSPLLYVSDQHYHCSITIVTPTQNRVGISFSSVTLASIVVDVLPSAAILSVQPTVFVPAGLTSMTVFGHHFDACDVLTFKCDHVITPSRIVSSSIAIVEVFLHSHCENAIFFGSCISETSISLLALSPWKLSKFILLFGVTKVGSPS